jgi:hypothetical protein
VTGHAPGRCGVVHADDMQPTTSVRPTMMLVIALVVGALIPTGVALGRWWTHPDLFHDAGYGFVAAPMPLADSALSIPVELDAEEGTVITFRGARAQFAANSAGARATFAICSPRPERGLFGVARDPKPFCKDLHPLTPGTRITATPLQHGEYVVMTVQPTRPGKARVDRIDLDYALGRQHLYRRGTDTLAVNLTARAR